MYKIMLLSHCAKKDKQITALEQMLGKCCSLGLQICNQNVLSDKFLFCREKELLKERRRKRQELFQEQKVSFVT